MSEHLFWHHHGGVSVPNLDEAIKWYHDVLGFNVEVRFKLPHEPCEIAMMINGHLRMELFEMQGAKPLPEERRIPDMDLKTHGNKHVSFATENVDTFAEELRKRGADIHWVKRFPHGANIFLRDCAGNLIEVVEMPRNNVPAVSL